MKGSTKPSRHAGLFGVLLGRLDAAAPGAGQRGRQRRRVPHAQDVAEAEDHLRLLPKGALYFGCLLFGFPCNSCKGAVYLDACRLYPRNSCLAARERYCKPAYYVSLHVSCRCIYPSAHMHVCIDDIYAHVHILLVTYIYIYTHTIYLHTHTYTTDLWTSP